MEHTDPEARLAAVQRRQLGAFTRSQAVAVGVTGATVDGRRRSGRYRVLLPRVLAEAGVPDRWELRAMAASLWAGGDALLARGSAARIHGLPVPRVAAGRLHLLVAHRRLTTPAGLVVHRTGSLLPRDATVVGPLPVTSVARTLCDLAGEVEPVALRAAVAAAVRDQLVDATELRADLGRLGRVRGAVALRRITDELSPLDAQCRSELETVYLRVARSGGIEPTAMNHPIRDADGRRRYLDAVHLNEQQPIELDSSRFHSSRLDRADDRARDLAIVRTGRWRPPLRFTWADVHDRPGYVVHTVREALAFARQHPL